MILRILLQLPTSSLTMKVKRFRKASMNRFPRTSHFAICLIAGTLTSAFGQDAPFAGHTVVRVTPRTSSELMAVHAISTNIWSCNIGLGPIDVQVTPAQRAALEELGLECIERIPDVQALVDAEREQIREARMNRDASWFTTFKTLGEINTRLDALAAASGGLATTFVVGNSLEGRPVRGIRFSGPDLPGNPRSSRPAALFAGGIHAREWVSPMTAMYIADRMIENYSTDPAIFDIMNTTEIIVIPVQNPDGYEFSWASAANRLWRKNRRTNADGSIGVDLNRNFGFQWGGLGASTTPNNDTYRGTSAFSEPETQIFRDFVSANPQIKSHIDFHSYSQLILTPWGWTDALPPDADIFRTITGAMEARIEAVNGLNYVAGPTYTTIYPASGGAHDWTYGDRNILGMTIELRDQGQTGFVLPADQILPCAQENFEGVLILADYTRRALLLSVPLGSGATIPESGASVQLNVRPGTSTLVTDGARIRYRRGTSGDFSTVPMSGGATQLGTLPSGECGESLQWYFETTASNGVTVRYPEHAPATVLSAEYSGNRTLFSDAMESDTGWTVGAAGDNATAGLWARADPVGTVAQPENDTTPNGTLCWVTGAPGGGAGANDLDGGITTLTSPRFDARAPRGFRLTATRIACSLWYSNNQGSNPNADSMPISISTDNGATWTQIADISANVGTWWTYSARVEDFVTPGANMRIRFVARDLGGGSVVEAAIDDFTVTLEGCRTADYNGDGAVDGDDTIAYFIDWDSANIDADYTDDSGVDGDDVIRFFTLWDANR